MNLHLQAFIKAVAEHQSRRSGGARAVSYLTQQWRQRFSVCLQRSLSMTVMQSFRTIKPLVHDGELPSRNGFLEVQLLVRPQPLIDVQQAAVAVVGSLDVH